jgi:hypothetical protein
MVIFMRFGGILLIKLSNQIPAAIKIAIVKEITFRKFELSRDFSFAYLIQELQQKGGWWTSN